MLHTQQVRTTRTNGWVVQPRPNPQAQLRLFCFHYAGSGASIYRTWPNYLPPGVALYAIQLPGREDRLLEPPFTRMPPLLHALAQELMPYLGQPFVFFGHSMGALVSFELARLLRRHHDILPVKLLVSGRHAPHLPLRHPPVHQLPVPTFIDHLRRLDGTPTEILENPELLDLLLPTIQADFAVCETYQYAAEAPLACPITAFGGSQDRLAELDELHAWKRQTSQAFTVRILPGNHFFIQHARHLMLQMVVQELSQTPSYC